MNSNTPTDLEAAFDQARRLHQQGRYADAEQAYQKLLTPGPHREPVLVALTQLYIDMRRPNEAIESLTRLTELLPDRFDYFAWLGTLLDQWGQTGMAIERYREFLGRHPDHPLAHFNLALLLKRQKEYDEALGEYQRALDTGYDNPPEVWSNMGVLYSDIRDAEKAQDMFETALRIDTDYVPALFNLAGLHEEIGNREKAVSLYERIREIDPTYYEALARLAHARRIESPDDPIFGLLEEAAGKHQKDRIAFEALWFALGKVRDDVGNYDDAAKAYAKGNQLGRKRNPPFDAGVTSRAFDDLIRRFDAGWLEAVETDAPHTPVFICGMLRSGSTLAEQLLAGHPQIRAGGEIDILPWLISRRLSPYPERAAEATRRELREMADTYAEKVRAIFGPDGLITDKRPDNFVHLGIARAMFPNAKFIHTVRNPLDTCLSIWFQQLGEYMAYATDIASIAQFHLEHDRLMKHWSGLFGDSIFTLDYDELVKDPKPVLEQTLEFLGLPWDDGCLEFQNSDTMVKTASVWQVREGLYEGSSGRWQNYASLVEGIRPLFSTPRESS